ncbi:hypothetical protein DNTS_005189 [Danionella cerebrum]|uniref:Chemokine interleukin-8-like domain-containing protein n=1 Tax=Danionella cerebrum TaxID=2873325 RepID=A0A553QUE4_9TELE|nr:hypothetical protein DNTS_005189 [Danionella translucida]
MQTITISLITAVLCCSTNAFSDIPLDCCLSTKNTRIPLNIVASYFHQTTESGCPIDATIHHKKRQETVCPTKEIPLDLQDHHTPRKQEKSFSLEAEMRTLQLKTERKDHTLTSALKIIKS